MFKVPLLRHIAALLSGGMVPLAFAPFNLWWLMPLAMAVPMLLWQSDRPRQGFLHGWMFGFAMFGFGLAWIRVSIGIYGDIPGIWAILLTALLAAILALYTALLGAFACCGRNLSPSQRQLVWIPSLWLVVEWLRARMPFDGFSWLTPGYSQVSSPLAGLMPLGGTLMVLAVLSISAGLVVLSVQRSAGRSRNLAALSVLWLAALAVVPLQWTTVDGDTHNVALVQGAIPQKLKWEPEYLHSTKELYWKLSEPLWPQAELVLWPEAVIPAFQHQIEPYLRSLDVKRQSAALMLGIPTYDREDDKFHNSMIVLSDDFTGQIFAPGQVYHKRRLVPFGEYLPLAGLLAPLFNKFNIPYSDFSSGDSVDWLPTPMGAAGIMICYEIIFANSVRDKLPQAKILINISNDAWFGDSIGPHQHLQIARTRARETGRFVLRATNSGISAVIDPQARVLAQSQQFQAEVVTAEVNAMTGSTPYVVLGDAPMLLLALALIALLLWRPVSPTLPPLWKNNAARK
ncbi:MAG: apolipoprotein N-acyltransferase [Candidatus Porifericomitaceae bacterium WSBS_2022_MAG_OTU9]